MSKKIITIATRKSKLALWQTHFVKASLEKKYPDLEIRLHEMVTEGDRNQTVALTEIGGKSVFVKALQTALLDRQADMAVHSVKDMSVNDSPNLVLAAFCERADPRDAFVSNHYDNLNSLPHNAIVGTSSPRRASLVLSLRPDLRVTLLRGNVDTRLAKLDNQDYDAIILAAAGLHRLGLSSRIRAYFSDDVFTPAIGQGAIGIECREDDSELRDMLRFLNHETTAHCVRAERTVNKILGGNCHTAIGAHAKIINDTLHLHAVVASEKGDIILRTQIQGNPSEAEKLGAIVADDLIKQGAEKLVHHG